MNKSGRSAAGTFSMSLLHYLRSVPFFTLHWGCEFTQINRRQCTAPMRIFVSTILASRDFQAIRAFLISRMKLSRHTHVASFSQVTRRRAWSYIGFITGFFLVSVVALAQRIPSDPAVRYQGFTPRLDTWLPGDLPQYWNFDPTNRAEAQDAYWRIYSPATRVPFAFVTQPDLTTGAGGTTTQAYRDAELRLLNYVRVEARGKSVIYLTEDTSQNAMEQATALLMSRNGQPNHFPPTTWIGYNALAAQGASLSLLAYGYTNPIRAYMRDSGPMNVTTGHRRAIIGPGTNLAAVGDVGATFTNSNAVYLHHDANWTVDPNYRNGDPVTRMRPYPYGWVSYDLFDSAEAINIVQGGGLRISIWYDHNAIPNTSAATISVIRNGIPITANVVNNQFGTIVAEIPDEFVSAPTDDVVFDVSGNGVGVSHPIGWHPGQVYVNGNEIYPADVEPSAGTYDRPRTVSWRFTVYDPNKVKAAAYSPKTPITGISTRAVVGTGSSVLIAGFVIQGTDPLRVALRARGPGLAQYGVSQYATKPVVDLYSGLTDLGSNQGWKNSPNFRLLQSFQLNPENDLDSAAVATLPPGAYTAIVRDAGGGGVGIVEVYNADSTSNSRLVAISTRGQVGTVANVMISGFVVQNEARTVLIRGVSPALAADGITGFLATPQIQVYSRQTVIGRNAGGNTDHAAICGKAQT